MRRLLSPKLLALHVLGLVATTAAGLLGLWQLDAWQAGRTLAARDLATARPVSLDSVLAPDAAFRADDVGRPVSFSGEWLRDATLLVEDREHQSRQGLWVVTPVAVCQAPADCAGAPAILVVRGWTADRDDLPAAPSGAVHVSGWLQPGEGSGLPDPDPTDTLLPELRIASAIQHVDQDLYGGFVVAEEISTGAAGGGVDATAGLASVTPASLPEPESSTSLRNLLYAVEWWVFAGFAGFLWWRWVRDELDQDAGGRPTDVPDHPTADEAITAEDGGPARQQERREPGIASIP